MHPPIAWPGAAGNSCHKLLHRMLTPPLALLRGARPSGRGRALAAPPGAATSRCTTPRCKQRAARAQRPQAGLQHPHKMGGGFLMMVMQPRAGRCWQHISPESGGGTESSLWSLIEVSANYASTGLLRGDIADDSPGGKAGLLLSRGGEGGRGFWTQNLVYQKWPDQIFPVVNFVFSHYGHFGLGGGGGGFRGGPPPTWFLIILKKPWGKVTTQKRQCAHDAPLTGGGTTWD